MCTRCFPHHFVPLSYFSPSPSPSLSLSFALFHKATFPNLFELVEYFKREPLRTVDYSVLLTEPVPQPAPHEDRKWFHKGLSRSEAEDWLKRIRSDGAFLVRASESDKSSFAISFRYVVK